MKILFRSIRKAFSGEVASQLAARLGESESAINKAMKAAAVPMVLSQLASKATEENRQVIYDLSTAAHNPSRRELTSVTGILGIWGSGPAHGSALALGNELLTVLFGAESARLAPFVGAYAGIQVASAAAVLQLVTAVLAALLGQFSASHNLSASGLERAVTRAKYGVNGGLPRDLPNWPGRLLPGAPGVSSVAWAVGRSRPYWLAALVVAATVLLLVLITGERGASLPAVAKQGSLLALDADTTGTDSAHLGSDLNMVPGPAQSSAW